jgi:DNA-binding protein H-NS
VAPKYRDPESGNTWSGRGKPPRWIAGQDRDQFLIQR